MDLEFKLYPRGFILSTEESIVFPAEYDEIIVFGKYHYAYSRDTDSLVNENQRGFVILHGNFKYVHYEKEISNDELPEYLLNLYFNNYTEFLNTLDFIAGRYALIIGDNKKVKVYQDATGGRSVYYSEEYNIISSHAHFINDNKIHLTDPDVEKVKKLGISWDLSPYINIKALTPNICLEFYSKKRERFFPRENNKYTELNHEEKIEIADNLWKQQQDYFFRKFPKLVFSITGGLDSKVSLAMMKNYIPKTDFFTYMTEVPNPENEKNKRLLRNDGLRVKELLKDIKLNHEFIKIENTNKNLTEKDKENLEKNTVGKHNFGLLRPYKELYPEKEVLHIRSNLNEIGRANLMEKNVGNNIERVKKYFVNSFTKANEAQLLDTNIDLYDIAEHGINSFEYNNDRFDFHIMDLYYWENRTGRWISEILNETDVCFETFSSYNLRAIIEISLSFKFEERKASVFFKDLINNNYSILNFYGINSDKNLYEQYKELTNNIELNETHKSIMSYSQKSSEKIYEKINTLKADAEKQMTMYNNQLKHIMMMNENNIKNMSINVPANLNEETSIFKNFNIYQNNEKIEFLTEEANTIFIPSKHLKQDSYAEFNYTFHSNLGYLELVVNNSYKNLNAINYLKYTIALNGIDVCEEDISMWKYENRIIIYNLNKNDIISLRVIALKDCSSESWAKASRICVTSLQETSMNYQVPKSVSASSPYTKIISSK